MCTTFTCKLILQGLAYHIIDNKKCTHLLAAVIRSKCVSIESHKYIGTGSVKIRLNQNKMLKFDKRIMIS